MKAFQLRTHIIHKLFTTVAVLLAGGVTMFAADQSPPPKPPDTIEALKKSILGVVTQPRYDHAFWGVKFASLDTGKTIFEWNSAKLFSPASNSKLYTMAMVLDRFGPDYRIKTSLYSKARPDASGTLAGDLIVYGRGDPTISGEYNGGNVLKAFEPLVAALTNAGVKHIDGDLVGDASYFHSEPYGSGWQWDDLETESGAEISALTINSNVLQLVVKPGDSVGALAKLTLSPMTSFITVINRTETTGAKTKKNVYDIYVHRPLGENTIYVTGKIPVDETKGGSEDVTMHDPAALFVSLFKEVLAQHGITVAGKTYSVHWIDHGKTTDTKSWIELGYIKSQPMSNILRSVQKPSQNLYTDMMLEYAGVHGEYGSDVTSEEAGIKELNKYLEKIGITKAETIFEDGSGMSGNNLTTPDATVRLLTFMNHDTNAAVYYNALPVAGVDGTLHARMKGTAAENNVHAKTGTLHWANALSGYMTNAAGEHIVFSMMLNRFENLEKGHKNTEDIDQIAAMVAKYRGRTGK